MKSYSNEVLLGTVNVQSASTSAFQVGPSGSTKFQVDGSVTPSAYLLQGTPLLGYSGNYVGPTFVLSAATGNLSTPGGISAASYGASTGGVSRMYTNQASGALQVNTQGAANVGLIVQGAAAQTGALQQWTDSAGVVKAYMLPSGTVAVANIIDPGGTLGPYISMATAGVTVVNRTGVGNIPFTVQSMAGQTGDHQRWQTSAGTVLARIDGAGQIISSARTGVGNVPFIAKAMVGQTGDLTQWQDSAGAVIARIKATTAQTGTPAAATDLATALTLLNDLRTKLLNLGLIS